MGGLRKSNKGTSVTAAEVVTPAVAKDSDAQADAAASRAAQRRAQMRGVASTYYRDSGKNKLGQ